MIDARAYFDDSGTHAKSVVTVIAGYAAIIPVWENLNADWNAALKDFREAGVRAFHASPCLGQREQFENIDRVMCGLIYRRFSDILANAPLAPIWAAVKNEDWEAVTNTKFRELVPSPYDFCMDRVLGQLASWSGTNADGSGVPMVVAVQKDHESETRRTVNSWKGHRIISERIGALEFDFPDGKPSLQAADMLAHEVYRHFTWIHARETGGEILNDGLHPRVLHKITRGRRTIGGGFYDREFLEAFAADIREEPLS